MTTKKFTRKQFIKFYKEEMDFSDLKGVSMSSGYKKELNNMYDIYEHSETDSEFMKKMKENGFDLI